jgi:hypothetical protein
MGGAMRNLLQNMGVTFVFFDESGTRRWNLVRSPRLARRLKLEIGRVL